MFLASNICCVSSGTVNARYCCEPREVSGAKPGIKKWRRGKGTLKGQIRKECAFLRTNHVDGQFTQISVKLTGESETRGDA